jgi:hypothetical protein
LGQRKVLELWSLAPLCLHIWIKWNARSFEDCEMVMLELKKRLFQSLYTWIVVLFRLSVFIYEFLEFCSSFSIL